MLRNLEIMDTTLRDGEQTSGVSYSPNEKLTIAKLLLEELNVDRIEVASARVSDGELNSVKQITNWAKENKKIDRIEVLTFLDDGKSLKWLMKSGCNVQNLLTKGSLNHLKHQLKKTPKNHFKDISKIIIAYEPVWSIGTGLIPKSNDLTNSISYIKSKFGRKTPKVLYGGSVNNKNIDELKDINIIDGFLVGGASQNSKKFIDIIKKTFN